MEKNFWKPIVKYIPVIATAVVSAIALITTGDNSLSVRHKDTSINISGRRNRDDDD